VHDRRHLAVHAAGAAHVGELAHKRLERLRVALREFDLLCCFVRVCCVVLWREKRERL
jgi:hypothetical protein